MFAKLYGATILTAALFMSHSANAGIFGDAPDIVVCPLEANATRESGNVVFYIDGTENDTPFYKALGNMPVQLSINTDGTLETRIPSCAGKTFDDLRQSGQSFNFTD